MKTQRRRGFTVVELVVVIAIIAVLAAVLIPTFTSIIKKANDSAYLQERQSQQIADLAEKVDKINYFTWEDFEKKLAEELAKIGTTDTDEIQKAVKAAMDQYQASHGTGDTGLSEEQVKKIVAEAISESGQLTSAQVEAIVRQAIAQNPASSSLTEAQVRAIVNAAVANVKPTGVSKTDVEKAIASALKNSHTLSTKDVQDIVSQALAGFSTLTAEEVEDIVSAAIAAATPASDTVYIAGNMTLSDPNVTYVLRTMNALGTVTLTVPDGVTVKAIIIDAPNVQTVDIIYKNGASAVQEVKNIQVISTASTSTHIKVNVKNMEVNSGRAVVEEGATVKTLTAAPSKNANVTVVISEGTAVTQLNAEYQDNGSGTNDTIEIINKGGTINAAQLTASAALTSSGTTTTNVTVTTEQGATTPTPAVAEADQEKLEGAVVTQTTTTNNTTTTTTSEITETGTLEQFDGVARIGTRYFTTLNDAMAAVENGEIVVLLKDINVNTGAAASSRLAISKSITFDGQNHKIYINNRGFGIGMNAAGKIDVTFKDVTIVNSSTAARCIDTRGNVSSLTLDHVTLDTNGASGSYIQPLTIGGNQSDKATIIIKNNSTIQTNDDAKAYYAIITYNPVELNITDSTIRGWACIYAKGKDSSEGSHGSVYNITNSVLESNNVYSGSTNSFGVIVLEDQNISVNLTQSTFNVDGVENDQYLALFKTDYGNCAGSVINFSSGNVINLKNSAQLVLAVEKGSNYPGTISVTGGTFSVDPSAYVADGYVATDNGDGTWTVYQNGTLIGTGQNPNNTPGPNPSFPF